MSSGSERMVRRAAILIAAASVALAASLTRVATAPGPTHLIVQDNEPVPSPPDPRVLRVCADPNNLPFSNAAGKGFENEIAALVARDLGRRIEYYWQPQRRGFIRTTLKAGWCDVVIGTPAHSEMVTPTMPYYRSSYVFVSRRDRRPPLSLDDPRLRRLRIGVEMTGEDYENPPAVQALASRHIIENVRGYLVYGDYSTPDPPRQIIDAVSRGDVDVAIAWGPLAGYFTRQAPVALALTPVTPERDGPGLSFTFDIAMGVRRGDSPLRDALNRVIASRAEDIHAILQRFGVPLVPREGT